MRLLLALLLSGTLAAMAGADEFVPVSGYEFMEPATRELQDDDFLNPAFFLVEAGQTLWNGDWPGVEGVTRSCASCHGDPESLRGAATRYPKYDEAALGLVNLELKINGEIVDKLGAKPLAYESDEMLALTALVGFQSRDMPMAVEVDILTRPQLERGREMFEKRRGQLNLACKNCHQEHWGEKLRGDIISQGQINAFPIFRLTWGEVGSRHRMFTWCIEAIRSEPYAYGSDEYLALELYLAVRGNGLPVETPGVRR
jgi:sulfur-oxidizing protein SoxA